MEFLYSPNQVERAADFIVRYNPHVTNTAKEVEKEIYRSIAKWFTDEGIIIVGTKGYYIYFNQGEESVVHVNVLVDPAISDPLDINKCANNTKGSAYE